MPIHAKKKEQPFEVNISVREATRTPKPVKKKPEPFVAPDSRCEQCYYWRFAAESTNWFCCCHYALDTGKLRTKISKTECGSFASKDSKPKRKSSFTDVPVSQWGCPEVIDWKTQR